MPSGAATSGTDPAAPVTVSLITGFLGSGKTTLLNHLLAHPRMEETAVLINEFGEIGLDHLMVKELDDDVVLLKSGCICCTVQGELVDGMRELYLKRVAGTLPRFTRVVIETTGLADPLPIVSCLMRDPLFKHAYGLDSLITTVDGVHGLSQLERHEEAVRQAAVADRILITKRDLSSASSILELRARLNALNPGADEYMVEHGRVEPAMLFGASTIDPAAKLLDAQAPARARGPRPPNRAFGRRRPARPSSRTRTRARPRGHRRQSSRRAHRVVLRHPGRACRVGGAQGVVRRARRETR